MGPMERTWAFCFRCNMKPFNRVQQDLIHNLKFLFGFGVEILLEKEWMQDDQLGENHSHLG